MRGKPPPPVRAAHAFPSHLYSLAFCSHPALMALICCCLRRWWCFLCARPSVKLRAARSGCTVPFVWRPRAGHATGDGLSFLTDLAPGCSMTSRRLVHCRVLGDRAPLTRLTVRRPYRMYPAAGEGISRPGPLRLLPVDLGCWRGGGGGRLTSDLFSRADPVIEGYLCRAGGSQVRGGGGADPAGLQVPGDFSHGTWVCLLFLAEWHPRCHGI